MVRVPISLYLVFTDSCYQEKVPCRSYDAAIFIARRYIPTVNRHVVLVLTPNR